MKSPASVRCSFSLPSDQAALLRNAAGRLGASQSALLSLLLEATLNPLLKGLAGQDDAEGPARRWGGQHATALRGVVYGVLKRARGALQLDLHL